MQHKVALGKILAKKMRKLSLYTLWALSLKKIEKN